MGRRYPTRIKINAYTPLLVAVITSAPTSVSSLSLDKGRFFFRVILVFLEEASPSRLGVVPGVDFCGAGEMLSYGAGEFKPVPVLVVVVIGEGERPRRRVETRRGAITTTPINERKNIGERDGCDRSPPVTRGL